MTEADWYEAEATMALIGPNWEEIHKRVVSALKYAYLRGVEQTLRNLKEKP